MIIIVNLSRETGESIRQYIYRIGQAKDNGDIDLTWEELLPTMNKECDCDTGESVFRKRYAEGKAWWKEVFQHVQPEEYISKLQEETYALQKERVKLKDERTALNQIIRDEARKERNMELFVETIESVNKDRFKMYPKKHILSDCDLLVHCADWHIGSCFNSWCGEYNINIAKERLETYLSEIEKIATTHKAQDCHVVVGGDMISGNIHTDLRITNRENVVEQVMMCAELMSNFLYELKKNFREVWVYGVSGNHSRVMPNRHDSLLGENLDKLVLWYAKASLSDADGIYVVMGDDDFKDTLQGFIIRDKMYFAVHGDYDTDSKAGLSKLASFVGEKPYAVIGAHEHESAYVGGDIVYVRGGSLCGSGDDFTIKNRLSGRPSQTVCVCDEDGIRCIYPVML